MENFETDPPRQLRVSSSISFNVHRTSQRRAATTCMGSPRPRKYGERLGGAPTQNYAYVRSVRLAAGMATANQPPRCARCRPTASEALSRSKKYLHNRSDPACKGRAYNKRQGLAPAATATGTNSTLLPGQQTTQSSLWGTQAPVAVRRGVGDSRRGDRHWRRREHLPPP